MWKMAIDPVFRFATRVQNWLNVFDGMENIDLVSGVFTIYYIGSYIIDYDTDLW